MTKLGQKCVRVDGANEVCEAARRPENDLDNLTARDQVFGRQHRLMAVFQEHFEGLGANSGEHTCTNSRLSPKHRVKKSNFETGILELSRHEAVEGGLALSESKTKGEKRERVW